MASEAEVDLQGAPRDKVDAAVAFHAKETGKEWKLTMMQGTSAVAGGTELRLVLCSGDLCSMETFVVADDNSVTKKKASLF